MARSSVLPKQLAHRRYNQLTAPSTVIRTLQGHCLRAAIYVPAQLAKGRARVGMDCPNKADRCNLPPS